MGPPKNQVFLVRVLKECLSAGVDAWLVLVGNGPDREKILGEAERLGILGRLVIPGYMDSTKVYSAFDAFAFPSRYEGLGMAALEAQAAGLPCIISDTVPHEVAITDRCGFLPIDDPLPWARAIVDASPSLEGRSCALPVDVRRKYDVNAIAGWLTKRYLDLCEGVVA